MIFGILLEKIISYQNIIGNYNQHIKVHQVEVIISYQNIIGNYNKTVDEEKEE